MTALRQLRVARPSESNNMMMRVQFKWERGPLRACTASTPDARSASGSESGFGFAIDSERRLRRLSHAARSAGSFVEGPKSGHRDGSTSRPTPALLKLRIGRHFGPRPACYRRILISSRTPIQTRPETNPHWVPPTAIIDCCVNLNSELLSS